MKDTFCVLPWMHLATNASGNLRVCCNSTPGKNFIEKPNGSPFKIWRDNIEEAWNSETYQMIRQQMLNGERPEMCERCFREEDAGLKSARIAWNESWQVDNPSAHPPLDIKYVDIRLGNLCNLKCRMCNPYASNQWVDEWELVVERLSDVERARLRSMPWPELPHTWNELAKLADSIEEIYLTGGEPTLSLAQYELFDRLIESGHAKGIRLKYNTNLTNIPGKMIEYWKHFKQIKINASIDAFGDLNRYIRYPTNWKSVDKNLRRFVDMDVRLQVHVTVQAYNILHLDKLFDYLQMVGAYNIYLNILNHPSHLNIRVLPQDIKEMVADRLNAYLHIDKVQGVIDYMAEDWSNELPGFVKYTKTLDASRNENLLAHVPEYENLINNIYEDS